MQKFQVQDMKLPKKADGNLAFAVGEEIQAESMKALIEKYPSLNGKVKRMLEVAAPEKKPGRPKKEA